MKRIKTAPALATNPDSGNVQFAVRLVGKGQLAVAENQKSGPGLRRFGEETAAAKNGFHGKMESQVCSGYDGFSLWSTLPEP